MVLRLLLLTSILILTEKARSLDRCEVLAKDYHTPGQRVAIFFLDKIGSSIQGKLKRLRPEERQALGFDPYTARALEAFAKRAEKFLVCGSGYINGHQDAVRHFVLGALLASKLGRVRAKELLDAHETRPDKDNDEFRGTLMDLRNNAVGIEVGSRYFKEGILDTLEGTNATTAAISDKALILGLADAFRQNQLSMVRLNDASSEPCAKLFKLEKQILANPEAPVSSSF